MTMKNVLTIAVITLFSSVVTAENSPAVHSKLSKAVNNITINSDIVLTNNESNSLELWEYLDNNKDGSISKMEAAISGEVFDNWDSLDTNNDKKIDTEEFVHLFYRGN